MKYIGRPRKYENPEEMQIIIDQYFNDCIEEEEVPTVTGLGYYLDMSRQDILRYEDAIETGELKNCSEDVKRGFRDTIKRAKRRIEAGYEQTLFKQGKTIGAIFTLKNNCGWVDKQEVEQTNKTIEVTLED